MEQELYWIWLQNAIGFGSVKIKTILSFYPTAYDFYRGGLKDWRLCGCFTPKELEKIEASSLEEARKKYNRCKELGQEMITPNHQSYPSLLKDICNPPCILYVKGKLPDFSEKLAVAIVGTRSATPYGKSAAFDLGFGLAKLGAVVVSGGALGIDGAAHQGALQADGSTVAVLGCGLNVDYLKENASLRFAISQSGALISEFPPDTQPARWTFPMRNRLISGLARGTVVVEAGVRSGALITANLALEQGRDVFTVPGNVNSSVSGGTNHLLKEGARPVTCINDILEEYENQYHWETEECGAQNYGQIGKEFSEAEPRMLKKEPELTHISPNGIQLYHCLEQGPIHVNELVRSTGLSVRLTLQALTELELNGLVQVMPGRHYQKI